MLCSLLVLLVLVVLVRSGLPVPAVLVLVLFVLVLFVLFVPAVVVLVVLSVLVLVDSRLLAEAFCTANGSVPTKKEREVPTRASSSSVTSIRHLRNTRRALLANMVGINSGRAASLRFAGAV